MEIYYTLVGTASERKVRISQIFDERTIDKDIQIRKDHAQARVRENFLILETGIAPYSLAGFFFYATGKFGEGFNLIKRVTSGECHICEFVILYNVQEFLHGHFLSALEVPGLGVVAAGAAMGTACAVN